MRCGPVSADRGGRLVRDPETREVILRCAGIAVAFDGVKALDGADLEVRRGDVHALIGPNGAGKTTLANVITGHVLADVGEVRFHGEVLRGAPWRRAARGVGRKFQVPRVFPRLTGRQNLEIANARATFGDLDPGRLAEVANRTGASLGHGLRQWLELQMVLAQKPSLVVLDEPTAGLSGGDRRWLADAITTRTGVSTFLVVEHDLDFVASIADRVSFMMAGRVVLTGTFAEVRHAEIVRATYLGTYA
jgi:urea transport system ATP-binding protein